jgi:hypothetical protein
MKLKTLNKIRTIAKKRVYDKINKRKRKKVPLNVLNMCINFKAWDILCYLKKEKT